MGGGKTRLLKLVSIRALFIIIINGLKNVQNVSGRFEVYEADSNPLLKEAR